MKKYFIVCLLVVLSLVLTGMANAASTIGTNITTTGTFAQTTGSATAALFQKSSTLTALVVDTASGTGRVGVGAAPSTTFEVQGTASASYFFTQNAIQVAGVPGATATVAYSRFGTGTTGTPGEFASADDLLITGSLEVDGKASVASNFQMSGRFIADTAASHSFTGDVNISSYLVVGSATASSSFTLASNFCDHCTQLSTTCLSDWALRFLISADCFLLSERNLTINSTSFQKPVALNNIAISLI